MHPPETQTVLENVEVRIPCKGQAEPANLTVKCYKDGSLECPFMDWDTVFVPFHC